MGGLCLIGGVRRLASARLRSRYLSFPVMGQSLRFLARASMTGKLFSHTNRAVPKSRSFPQWRIRHKRTDKHCGWMTNRAALKSVGHLLANSAELLNHAGVTARGVVWLTVLPRDSQKRIRSSQMNEFQRTVKSDWVYCVRATELNEQSFS